MYFSGILYHYLVWDGLDNEGSWCHESFFDLESSEMSILSEVSTCNTRKVHSMLKHLVKKKNKSINRLELSQFNNCKYIHICRIEINALGDIALGYSWEHIHVA